MSHAGTYEAGAGIRGVRSKVREEKGLVTSVLKAAGM